MSIGFFQQLMRSSKSVSAVLGSYNPNAYKAADIGMTWPTKTDSSSDSSGSLGATYLYYGSQLKFISPPWTIPAGSKYVLGYSNIRDVEGAATGVKQERHVYKDGSPVDFTLQAASIQYVDGTSTTRVANAAQSGGSITNSGVLSGTLNNGGVLAIIPVTYAIPPNTVLTIRTAISLAAATHLISFYEIQSGEIARKSTDTSFATVTNNGTTISSGTNSVGASIGGFQYGPCAAWALGADRPTFGVDGDSINKGKGTSDKIAVNRVKGIVDTMLASTSNGARFTRITWCVAGSGYDTTDPARAEYDPLIQENRHALTAQVTALNTALGFSGSAAYPIDHIILQHFTNTQKTTLALQVASIKTRIDWLQSMYPGLPVTIVGPTPSVDDSSDGWRTASGQTVGNFSSSTGTRFQYADKLEADKLDGRANYVINNWRALSYDLTTNRSKWKIDPYTATMTAAPATPGGAYTIYLDGATPPQLGQGLVLNTSATIPQILIVIGVTGSAGAWTVTLDIGGSGITPSTFNTSLPIGTVVGGCYPSDGDPRGAPTSNGLGGLHMTAIANNEAAALTGPFSGTAWKAQIKSDLGGTWT